MLDPAHFEANQAWVAFQLNNRPILTRKDGSFNCLAIVDVGTGMILSNQMVPAAEVEPSAGTAQAVLDDAEARQGEVPQTLFVPMSHPMPVLQSIANQRSIPVVLLPDEQLLHIIGPPSRAFEEYLSGGME